MPRFRHKALAALLAAVTGALGLNRVYLGQRLWWLPLGITLGALPLLIGVRNWQQTPAFFVAMVPVVAGFLQALAVRGGGRHRRLRAAMARLAGMGGGVRVGSRLLLAWLATNLLLGSQVCWVLRPFIWDPAGPTRFIGREYFRGSFYETIFEALRRLAFP